MSVWTLLRITPLVHRKSYLVIIFLNVQCICKVDQKWNELKFLLAYRKSCLAIIGPKSNAKLTKYEIRSSYCLIQFGFIPGVSSTLTWHQNTIFVYIYNCLPIFTTSHLYFALFRLNYHYLIIFSLNCPDFTTCAIFTQNMYSSIKTIMYGDIALQIIWGCRKCWHECSLGVYLVIDNFWGIQSVVWLRKNRCSKVLGVSDFIAT